LTQFVGHFVSRAEKSSHLTLSQMCSICRPARRWW